MQAVDIFFDNIFSDWMVRDQIQRSQNEMYGLQSRIRGIQDRLNGELAEAEHQLSAAQADLDRWCRRPEKKRKQRTAVSPSAVFF